MTRVDFQFTYHVGNILPERRIGPNPCEVDVLPLFAGHIPVDSEKRILGTGVVGEWVLRRDVDLKQGLGFAHKTLSMRREVAEFGTAGSFGSRGRHGRAGCCRFGSAS